MNKDNDALLYGGLQLISQADDGMSTVKLKEAIKEIELLIHARENIPF